MKKFAGFADEAADTIEDQIKAIKTLGWNGIELRSIEKQSIQDLSDEHFQQVVEQLELSDIKVCCLGSSVANWSQSIHDPFEYTKDMVFRLIPRMHALKCSMVRVMSYQILTDSEGKVYPFQNKEERFKRLNWICDTFAKEGIITLHENCFNYGGLSWRHTLELLEAVPALFLVFDTGNPPIDIDLTTPHPYARQNSFEFYSQVKERIRHIHIKDSAIDADGNEEYFYPGEGKGDVLAIVKDLEKMQYRGWYSIEPHMETVFHNQKQENNDVKRFENFIEYGNRFEQIFKKVRTDILLQKERVSVL